MSADADVGAGFSRPTQTLIDQLLARRAAPDHWDGHLSSSALSTATAILALDLVRRDRLQAARPPRGGRLQPAQDHELDRCIIAGADWLAAHQNPDGGWGDTIRSRSNISTTAIAWASLSYVGRGREPAQDLNAIAKARAWLDDACGGSSAGALRSAILRRYGKDRTFSVPILTLLTLAGVIGDDETAWRSVPQLPFELAALPHGWFQHLSLPVVSYALPALIAIGQVRHHHAPSRNPMTRLLRDRARRRTLRLLRAMQPDSGGYLEATPLTSFVVMSLAGVREAAHPAADAGVRFLIESMRQDGSWPIDTNLSTWVTTLSIGAIAAAGALPADDVDRMRTWLLTQQSTREHPFTHAAAGAWAWTPLTGGVPDADDTAGALVALAHLGTGDARARDAAARGIRWLIDVQNRDGGIPTFCRGWGTLPFDRSTPEITAHALQAWSAWAPHVDAPLRREIENAAARALVFIEASQRGDGAWVPLWFGNEHAPHQQNSVYGTSRVLHGMQAALVARNGAAVRCRERAVDYLVAAQNTDGGWGGGNGAPSTLEESGVALAALAGAVNRDDRSRTADALARGAAWLSAAVTTDVEAAPIGLYFAELWYYEELYPLIFALEGLAAFDKTQIPNPRSQRDPKIHTPSLNW